MKVLTDLKICLQHEKFRKLLAIRLISQTGDGMFQIGLATLFFFNPQNATTAGGVALAFAVLLLPFTVVGPFAGPLLDRWRRRQVLYYGNLIRAVFTLVLAAIMMISPAHWAIYVLALVTLGINRFLLAALSAGLPHTLPQRLLVLANSITPTLGSVAAVLGAAIGFLLNLVLPAGAQRNAVALVCAAVLFTGAALAATRLGAAELGPEGTISTSLASELRKVISRLVSGVRYLIRRGMPAYGLGIMAIHRFLYGVNFIALILISRNLLTDPTNADAGLATFAVIAGISFAGNGAAIVLTPIAHERISPSQWIMICLGISALSQAMMAVTYRIPWIYVSAALLGLGVQGAKIAVDAIVQSHTHDQFRGRAFSLYDMLYNSAFVGAAVLAALVLPDTGWSAEVFLVLTGIYGLAAVWFWRCTSAISELPRAINLSDFLN
ncbi:MAG: MFS transporter [Trueperella sp.]|nr:MFS transporter [Trueperella sp.]